MNKYWLIITEWDRVHIFKANTKEEAIELYMEEYNPSGVEITTEHVIYSIKECEPSNYPNFEVENEDHEI